MKRKKWLIDLYNVLLVFYHDLLIFRLIVTACKCLIEEELSVSNHAHKLVKKLSAIRVTKNQIYIFVEPILSTLKEMQQAKTDALKLRVLELMVEISRISEEHMTM